MGDHGWTKYYNVDLLDATGPDLELDIPNGKIIKKNYFGIRIKKIWLYVSIITF